MNKKLLGVLLVGVISLPLIGGNLNNKKEEPIINKVEEQVEQKKEIDFLQEKELNYQKKIIDYNEQLHQEKRTKEKTTKEKESENKKEGVTEEEYQLMLAKENEASGVVNLEEKERIAMETMNLSEQELKARAQYLKDSSGGWVPEGELEPYDLPQPEPSDLILYEDNSNMPDGDSYNNYFIDKDQAFDNSVNYSYPYGPIYPVETENIYTINDLEYHGAMLWNGYKYTFYSQRVLPGGAMRIPGRHIADGFVVDSEGYITGASDYYPKGTILDSPFGRQIKIRDVFWHNQPEYRVDIYTR